VGSLKEPNPEHALDKHLHAVEVGVNLREAEELDDGFLVNLVNLLALLLRVL